MARNRLLTRKQEEFENIVEDLRMEGESLNTSLKEARQLMKFKYGKRK